MTDSKKSPSAPSAIQGTKALTAQQTKEREKKIGKIIERSLLALLMICFFGLIIYLGHCYLCLLVIALQTVIFQELVGVRIKQSAEKKMPFFRTLQWGWFFTAIFYSYGDEILSFAAERLRTKQGILLTAQKYHPFMVFSLYCMLFTVSVLSLRKGQYRYQISQYAWTLLTCSVVVFQMKAVVHLIFTGIFWFVLPTSLVICNDTAAYFAGQAFGKKIIKYPFLQLSPNKTWEGFLGGAMITLLFGFVFAGILSEFLWMVCTPDKITFDVSSLQCTPHTMYTARPVFQELVTSWETSPLPDGIMIWLMSIKDVQIKPVQFHGLVLGLFASSIAPFGGFLASAIKRAYGIKDYNNLIPGHGGVMDRMDCQFIMLLCTAVHYRTFLRPPASSVESVLAAAALLGDQQQKELLEKLQFMVSVKS